MNKPDRCSPQALGISCVLWWISQGHGRVSGGTASGERKGRLTCNDLGWLWWEVMSRPHGACHLGCFLGQPAWTSPQGHAPEPYNEGAAVGERSKLSNLLGCQQCETLDSSLDRL